MMRQSKNWWNAQSARINAMSLRERIFVFIAFIAVSMALADTLWLSPAQATYLKLVQAASKQSTELQRARADLKAVTEPVGTAKVLRDEVAAVIGGVDAANRAIRDISSSAERETPLTQVLVHLLRKHEGLTLVHVATLASDTAVKNLTTSGGPVAAVLTPGWPRRQGVELTVSGSYPELTRYLEMLENMLPQMRWGTMALKSEKGPPELTLQLFLVGIKP